MCACYVIIFRYIKIFNEIETRARCKNHLVFNFVFVQFEMKANFHCNSTHIWN